MKKQAPIVLDAHYCVDGVWRCDEIPVDHREDAGPYFEREGRRMSWGPYTTAHAPGEWDWEIKDAGPFTNPFIDQEELDRFREEERRMRELRIRLLFGRGPFNPDSPIHPTGT